MYDNFIVIIIIIEKTLKVSLAMFLQSYKIPKKILKKLTFTCGIISTFHFENMSH